MVRLVAWGGSKVGYPDLMVRLERRVGSNCPCRKPHEVASNAINDDGELLF
jgi:hypothetical protein